MNYELGYGKGIQKIEIPDANLMGVLLPENAHDWIDLAILHQLLTIHSANLPN